MSSMDNYTYIRNHVLNTDDPINGDTVLKFFANYLGLQVFDQSLVEAFNFEFGLENEESKEAYDWFCDNGDELENEGEDNGKEYE